MWYPISTIQAVTTGKGDMTIFGMRYHCPVHVTESWCEGSNAV